MAWFFYITDHCLHRGTVSATAGVYSGAFGPDQNCIASVGKASIGPIPPGAWVMTELYNDTKTGEDTIRLAPADVKTRAYVTSLGRDPESFRLHGDSIKQPGHGSEGCIVAPLAVRMLVWHSGDRALVVAASMPVPAPAPAPVPPPAAA